MNVLASFLLVMSAGGFAALIRSWLSDKFDRQEAFPFGTFMANMLACLGIGMIIAASRRFGLSEMFVVIVSAGFCATLSTFSSLAFQLSVFFIKRHFKLFFAYFFATLLGGLVLFYIGLGAI